MSIRVTRYGLAVGLVPAWAALAAQAIESVPGVTLLHQDAAMRLLQRDREERQVRFAAALMNSSYADCVGWLNLPRVGSILAFGKEL